MFISLWDPSGSSSHSELSHASSSREYSSVLQGPPLHPCFLNICAYSCCYPFMNCCVSVCPMPFKLLCPSPAFFGSKLGTYFPWETRKYLLFKISLCQCCWLFPFPSVPRSGWEQLFFPNIYLHDFINHCCFLTYKCISTLGFWKWSPVPLPSKESGEQPALLECFGSSFWQPGVLQWRFSWHTGNTGPGDF